jgi:hypothetical protein
MNILKPMAIAASLTLAAGGAQAATFSFEAMLDGIQAVPGSDPMSQATGMAQMVLDDSDESLTFSMDVDGIMTADLMNIATFGPVHIHRAPTGQTGPVAVPFADASDYSDTNDGFTLVTGRILFADLGIDFANFLATSNASGYYINIHTNDVGSGEIRGQLSPVPLPAAGFLLLAGLVGMGGLRRAKKAS